MLAPVKRIGVRSGRNEIGRTQVELSSDYVPVLVHKYHAKATWIDRIFFGSKAEAARYGELKLQERVGLISQLEVHQRFELHVSGKRVAIYIADFTYWDQALHRVVEDVKGVRTPLYKLKKKMLLAEYGIEIREVEA